MSNLPYYISTARAIEKGDCFRFFPLLNSECIEVAKPLGTIVNNFIQRCDGLHSLEQIGSSLNLISQSVREVAQYAKSHKLIHEASSISSLIFSTTQNPQLFPPQRGYTKPADLFLYSDSHQVKQIDNQLNNDITIHRHSTRLFTDDGISLNTLYEALRKTYYIGHHMHSVASGGSLFPLDIYVIINRSNDIKKGIYLWNPVSASLLYQENNSVPPLDFVFDSPYASQPACWFIIALASGSQLYKYGNRGITYAYIEAGQIARVLEETCSALGLGYLWYGGYIEKGVQQCLTKAPQRVGKQDLPTPPANTLLCCRS